MPFGTTPAARFDIKADDKTKAAFNGVNSGLKRMGRNFALVGAAAAAFTLVRAVKTTVDFEAAISDLSAITGATGKDLEFFSKEARRMGAVTTLSATQVAEAFKLVASAKPDLLDSAEALSAVTQEAIALAEAASITVPDAAITLGSALNQFSAGADEAARFINVLAAGAKFGASEIVDTAEALERAGVIAAGAGISFEELNTSIQGLAKVSLKGSDAGTALRNIILSLQTQTNDKFNPAIVGLNNAFKNLNKAGFSTVELLKIVDKRSLAATQALITQSGELDTLQGKLTGTNTAYEQAAIKNDNLKGDVKLLNSAYEELHITIGEKLTPIMRSFTQEMTRVTEGAVIFLRLFENPLDTQDGALDQLRDQLFGLVDQTVTARQEMAKLGEGPEYEGHKRRLEELRIKINQVNQQMLDLQNIETDIPIPGAPGDTDGGGPTAGATAAADELAKLREKMASRLEIIRVGLLGEQEAETNAFLNKLFIIEESRELELIGLGTFQTMKEQLEVAHEAKLAKIRINSEKLVSKEQIKLKQDVLNKSLGLLQMLGTKSKVFAVAAIVIEAALAAKKIFMATEVAAAAALMPPPIGLGPVAGIPLAASIRTLGAISAGLTVATGALQLGSLGGGGGGGAASGVFQADPLTGLPAVGGAVDTTVRADVTINIGDAQFLSAEAVRELIEQINEQIEDGVTIGSVKVA